VSYSIDANPSTQSRAGTIMVGGQTFTINQDGAPPPALVQVITPDPATQQAGPGDSVSIDVHYTTSSGEETLSGLGLRLHYDSSQLTFAGLSNIWATGLAAPAATYDDTADLDGDPSTDKFILVAWADTLANWPGVGTTPVLLYRAWFTTASGFSETTTLRFSASSTPPGYSLDAQSASIVSDGGCIYALEPSNALVSASGGADSFNVNTAAECAWTASPSDAWIHTTSSGTGPGSVSYSIDANPSTQSRVGTITVGGQTFTITQDGAAEPPTSVIALSGDLAFGDVTVGQSPTRTLTISNSGNADLTVASLTYPAGFTGAWTGRIPPGRSTNITVTFAPATANNYGGTVTVNSDATGGTNTLPISGRGIMPPPGTLAIGEQVLNPELDRQTGLFYQQVVVTNIGTQPVEGLRLSVTNLPAGVWCLSATGTNQGMPFVEFCGTIKPNQTLTLTLAYYSANRQAPVGVRVIIEPTVVSPPPLLTGQLQTLRNAYLRPDGKMTVEFDTQPGRTYAVQYQSDLNGEWKQAQPTVRGTGLRMLWLDSGPPQTETPPEAGARFYRVIVLP